MKYVVAKIDECDSATEVIKTANILITLRWVAQAWAKVKAETNKKRFRRAGVLNDDMSAVSCGTAEEDPFLDLDASSDVDASSELIQQLLDLAMPGNSCTIEDYVNGDNDLPICIGMNDDQWDEDFLLQLNESEEGIEEEGEEDEEQEQLNEPTIKKYKEAIVSLEVESRGHYEASISIGNAVDTLASLHTSSVTQRTIPDYFSLQ